MRKNIKILLVDDETEFLKIARLTLLSEGYSNVTTLADSRDIEESVKSVSPDIIFLDLTMPYKDGEECLQFCSQNYPEIQVIILTGLIEIKSAIRCMKNGAIDYLLKPIKTDELLLALLKASQNLESKTETTVLKERLLTHELSNPEAFKHIITQSKKMKSLFSYSEAICQTNMPILVRGETGTGKELMVKALHNLRDPNKPLISINVSGLDDHMFTDTLFGHTKGSYTGARDERKGLIEQAKGGTLFLDEIGDLKPESQIKLLRLLQEFEYFPIGADAPKKADVWVVAATHVDLGNSSSFRKDLYYRLQTHEVVLPPLSERKEDIELLIEAFTQKAINDIGLKTIPRIPANLRQRIIDYSFPGNIRELQGMIYDIIGSSAINDEISIHSIKRYFPEFESTDLNDESVNNSSIDTSKLEILPTVKEMESSLIREALQRTNNNKSAAAKLLGITRQTISKYQ